MSTTDRQQCRPGFSALCLVATALLGCRSESPTPRPGAPAHEGAAALATAVAPSASMQTLAQLINPDEPGITLVRSWIASAKNPTEALESDRTAGERSLVALQVTSRSPIGAIALETGGILIDHGWIRVLGSGHARLPRPIQDWNGIRAALPTERLPGAILIADDVVGGFFAINGGGIAGAQRHVFYFSPRSLRWEDIAPSYSEWLTGMMDGDLAKFYEGMRWPGWEKEVAALPGDRAFSFYPFLFTDGPEIGKRSRRAVPIEEVWHLHVEDLPRQLGAGN